MMVIFSGIKSPYSNFTNPKINSKIYKSKNPYLNFTSAKTHAQVPKAEKTLL